MDLKILQKDVANVLGVTEDNITNWEKNRCEPQINYYPKIIDFLGYFPFVLDTSTISGKLLSYRYRKGLSQKELGKILRVNGSTVRSWELGDNQPQKGMLERLKMVLKVE